MKVTGGSGIFPRVCIDGLLKRGEARLRHSVKTDAQRFIPDCATSGHQQSRSPENTQSGPGESGAMLGIAEMTNG